MNFIEFLIESASSKYTREQLLELDWDKLCEMAYGVKAGDIIQLDPKKIKLKHPDTENAQHKFDLYGMKWVRSVKFDEPIKVSLGLEGKNNKEDWYLEDGHHRLFAARKLKMPYITAEVESINLKAVEKLLGFPNAKKRNIKENMDYRGEHEAPTNDGYHKPLYDLTGIYDDDIYGPNAARYYGDGVSYDNISISIIQQCHNRPNAPIKVYRAVPKVLSNSEKIQQYEKEKAYMLKTGRLPSYIDNWSNKSEYYDYVSNEIEKLKQLPDNTQEKLTINPGDWITITKQYAIEHGKGNLNNKYKILSKTVYARDLYSDGNSIHEYGYDPQPRVSTRITK